jgi:hypothetical protein
LLAAWYDRYSSGTAKTTGRVSTFSALMKTEKWSSTGMSCDGFRRRIVPAAARG